MNYYMNTLVNHIIWLLCCQSSVLACASMVDGMKTNMCDKYENKMSIGNYSKLKLHFIIYLE